MEHATRRTGRPPANDGGVRTTDLPIINVHVHHATRALLDALAESSGTPRWRLVDEAIRRLALDSADMP